MGRSPAAPAAGGDWLGHVIPLVQTLLTSSATDQGCIVALTDADGHIRWIDGDRRARTRAEGIGFVEGEDWSEAVAGRNAPGRALAGVKPVSVVREEHSRPDVHGWSCAAAPVWNPATGEVAGVIDVTGGDAAVSALALVTATAAAADRELRLRHASGDLARHVSVPRLRLRLVHQGRPLLEVGGQEHLLSDRHAELLTLLAVNPQGLSGEEVAVLAYREGASPSTVRVELLRLRRLLESLPGAPVLHSRPYRLSEPVEVDAVEVTRLVGAGDHDGALDLYRGPALRRSEAPAVLTLLHETAATVREAMLADAAALPLMRYLQLPEAREDVDSWRTALRILPPNSPQRAYVVTHLDGLERNLA
ncbi:MAG: transcriptional regulator [Micrococcales bacterium]|nr:transcriptional regulator [Micrococcales bacterium]